MPSTCVFQLDNPNEVYFSGQTISGTIILTTTSAKNVRDVRIIFRGEGKVSWTELENRRNADGSHYNHTIYFRSDELYIDNATTVHAEGILPAGIHIYTIQIPLPLESPTSCEGHYGHIRYELMVKINIPFGFDKVFNKPFTVIKTQDLNLNPAFRIPIEGEEIFSSCCWPCSSGEITTTLKIPYSAYANGQTVNYTLHTQNQSMDNIEGYTIEFYRKIIFTAHTPYHKSREEKSSLFKNSYDTPCLRLTTRLYKGNFVISSTPPSTEGPSIISISYLLKITLNLAGCVSKKNMITPIFIGTIPLRESLTPSIPSEAEHLLDFLPSAPELPRHDSSLKDLPPSYQDICPPSFEEATQSDDADKQYSSHGVGFRPLYPIYSQTD